jgi:hypothetical protein
MLITWFWSPPSDAMLASRVTNIYEKDNALTRASRDEET